ncbi:alpha/beta hydrolase [Motiliproteus sediminis]|uniref:alpha/beta hydrolase n=1 Tax=Motiliproteus sediminis TaxID=1468178 RepID=UPI001AEF98CD|nr:alpha/beta hydrolase [Motiliproteus sediminis]
MSFDPSSLINQLPPLGQPNPAELEPFCHFYRLPCNVTGISQQLGYLTTHKDRIAVHRWTPPSPAATLLIVHGYLDHHGLYGHLIRYGLERNLAVVCFDLPGHGLSSGPRAEIDSFRHYQQVLTALLTQLDHWGLPKPLHLLGQSTGAAILNHYLLKNDPDHIGQIILLAPLVRAARWRIVDMTHRVLGRFTASVPRKFSDNSNDPDFVAFLKADPLQAQIISARWIGALKQWIPKFLALPPSERSPLVIQGEADDTVDWAYNLGVLREKYPTMELLRIPEARHQLANESDTIRQHYLEWIDHHWPRNKDQEC